MSGRLIAVGDIHGYADHLRALLSQIDPGAEDTLLFLGDYVDRGPGVPSVFDQLLSLEERVARVVFLRGNHEEFMLQARAEPRAGGWMGWGGLETVRAYHPASVPRIENLLAEAAMPHRVELPLEPFFAALPRRHLQFVERTVLYHQQDGFTFVHASLDPAKAMQDQTRRTLLSGSPQRLIDTYTNQHGTVVFGHTSTSTLREDQANAPFVPFGLQLIGLDTSVDRGGPLTAMEVRTRTLWQARVERP